MKYHQSFWFLYFLSCIFLSLKFNEKVKILKTKRLHGFYNCWFLYLKNHDEQFRIDFCVWYFTKKTFFCIIVISVQCRMSILYFTKARFLAAKWSSINHSPREEETEKQRNRVWNLFRVLVPPGTLLQTKLKYHICGVGYKGCVELKNWDFVFLNLEKGHIFRPF